MPSAPTIGGSSCATMDATSGLWQGSTCEAQLPYICKKALNNTAELTGIFLTFLYKWVLKLQFCEVQSTHFRYLFLPFFHPILPMLKSIDFDPVVRYYQLYMNKTLVWSMPIRRQR